MGFSSRIAIAAWRTIIGSLLLSGCLPPALAKYRDPSGAKKNDVLTLDALIPSSQAEDPRNRSEGSKSQPIGKASDGAVKGARVGQGNRSQSRSESPSISAIDGQTFRISARDEDVWEALLDVLLRHYTLTIVDRQGGIIATEWDTFTRGKVAYRNKIALRTRKSGRNTIDLTIRNNVERLRGLGEGGGTLGGVWLSSDDPSQEVRRIVQNLATLLEIEPPMFPSDSLSARALSGAGSGTARH
jgi:hypothetical protein